MPGRVLISYRRDDTAPWAGRIYEVLARSLGSQQVFLDVDKIELGADFVRRLQDQVAACDVLLALIGPSWQANLSQRANSSDFVRLEIEQAITSGKLIIPVLLDGARMPTEDELPPTLKPLVRFNATSVRHVTFSEDIARLVKEIRLHRFGDLPAESTPIIIASVFCVVACAIPYLIGEKITAHLFDFADAQMDFAGKIVGALVSTLVVAASAWALVKARGPKITTVEKSLYVIGVAYTLGVLAPEIFHIFAATFGNVGPGHRVLFVGDAVGLAIALVGVVAIFSERGPMIADVEWMVPTLGAGVFGYFVVSNAFGILMANEWATGFVNAVGSDGLSIIAALFCMAIVGGFGISLRSRRQSFAAASRKTVTS